MQDLVTLEGGRSICSFKDNFGLDVLSIVHIHRTINSTWRKYVALFSEQKRGILRLNLFSERAMSQTAMLLQVLLYLIWIKTLFGINSCISLNYANDFGSVGV